MHRLSCLVLTTLLAVSALPASARGIQRVPGGKQFSGSLLDIASPPGERWYVADGGSKGMLFIRKGEQRNASIAASVTTFPVAADADAATFEANVRESIRKEAEGNRYRKLTGASIVPVDHGIAHCLRYAEAVDDPQAQIGFGETQAQVLDVHALYCRHPADPTVGVSILYSVRAPKREAEQTERAAEAFFAGVVFKTPPNPAPAAGH